MSNTTKTNPYLVPRVEVRSPWHRDVYVVAADPVKAVKNLCDDLSIVTQRNDRKAGLVGWRISWDGDPHSEPSDGDAPAVYYLVETNSQQYSEEYGEPTYGVQVWRIVGGEITHDAWFACGSDDPATAVKKLCDVYIVAGAVPIYRVFLCYEAAIPPVDKESLRVVRAINSSYCYLVF